MRYEAKRIVDPTRITLGYIGTIMKVYGYTNVVPYGTHPANTLQFCGYSFQCIGLNEVEEVFSFTTGNFSPWQWGDSENKILAVTEVYGQSDFHTLPIKPEDLKEIPQRPNCYPDPSYDIED